MFPAGVCYEIIGAAFYTNRVTNLVVFDALAGAIL